MRVTIGRASDYFGQGGAHSVAGMLVTGALAGKTVRWPANADLPHTFSYLPDVARGLAVLGERDEANGTAGCFPRPLRSPRERSSPSSGRRAAGR